MTKISAINQKLFAESNENPGMNAVGKYRKSQADYSNCCADFFDEKTSTDQVNIAIIEGSTGVGKSLGYLIPLLTHSALTGKRVAIATYSRQLQKQLAKDIEIASRIVYQQTGKNLTHAYRFGSDEYIHHGSVCALYEECLKLSNDDKQISKLKEMSDWAFMSLNPSHENHKPEIHTGRITDFMDQNNLSSLPFDIKKRDICICYHDSDEERYCHIRDIQKSKETDVLIITQNMLMLHVRSGFEILDSERKIDSIVIDEADRITDAAISVFEKSISINKSYSAFKYLSTSSVNFQDAFEKYIALYDSLSELFSEVKIHPCSLIKHPEKKAALIKKTSSLLLTMNSALKPYEKSDNLTSEQRNLLGLKRELQHYLSLCAATDTSTKQSLLPFVDWSYVFHYPNLTLVALSAATLVSKLYANQEELDLKRIIFTSATLCNAHKDNLPVFDEFKHEIGLPLFNRKKEKPFKLVTTKSFNAENYGRISMFLAPNDLPTPFLNDNEYATLNPEFLEYTVTAIRYASNIKTPLPEPDALDCKNRTLVLCGSFKEVRAICEEIKEQELDMDIIFHQEGEPIRNYIQRFRDNPNAIFVTPSAWEGFDERIANLIITRFPNMPINDEIREKIGFLTSKGVDDAIANSMIRRKLDFAAIRKMTQGIGRLIRKENDCGRLFLLEPRISKPDPVIWYQEPHGAKDPSLRLRDIKPCLKSNRQISAFEMTCVLRKNGTVVNKKGQVRA